MERIWSPRSKPDDSKRKYLNWPTAAEDAWVAPEEWNRDARRPRRRRDHGADIVMFFDGSKSRDATALIGCDVDSGHVFTLGVWEPDPNDDEDTVDAADVDRVVQQRVRDATDVLAFFGDVKEWESFVKTEWPGATRTSCSSGRSRTASRRSRSRGTCARTSRVREGGRGLPRGDRRGRVHPRRRLARRAPRRQRPPAAVPADMGVDRQGVARLAAQDRRRRLRDRRPDGAPARARERQAQEAHRPPPADHPRYRPGADQEAGPDRPRQRLLDRRRLARPVDVRRRLPAAKEADNAEVWNIWQANKMDARQTGLHRATFAYGAAYAVVLPGDPVPVIRPASPRHLTAMYGEDPDWPMWALEKLDSNGLWRLYDEEIAYHLGVEKDPNSKSGGTRFVFIDSEEHGLGVVPVVRFLDEEDLDADDDVPCEGGVFEKVDVPMRGRIAPLMDIQGQIDVTTVGLLIAQWYTAFRQRWVIGWTADSEKELVKAMASEMATFEDSAQDVKVGQWDESSLEPSSARGIPRCATPRWSPRRPPTN
jgi:hypothetical protein